MLVESPRYIQYKDLITMYLAKLNVLMKLKVYESYRPAKYTVLQRTHSLDSTSTDNHFK